MTKVLVLFHANCPDGFGSAWLMHNHLRGVEVDLVPMKYGDPLPEIPERCQVVCVDFCPPPEQLAEIKAKADAGLILDHHQTAEGYVAESEWSRYTSVDSFMSDNGYDPFTAILDMTRSGVGLTQQWTGDSFMFLRNIEDRDLWKFQHESTPAVFAAVTSRPYTIEAWNEIADMEIADLVAEGSAIERYRQQLIEQIVETAYSYFLPDGTPVLIAACPYAVGSDVAGELAKASPSKIGAYFVPYQETVKFGLRSTPDGPDVAEIAARCAVGGGGHKHASGFEVVTEAVVPL